MKLQTELDLRSGALLHVAIEAARGPDGATGRPRAPRPAGSLRITDLGYFHVGGPPWRWRACTCSRAGSSARPCG